MHAAVRVLQVLVQRVATRERQLAHRTPDHIRAGVGIRLFETLLLGAPVRLLRSLLRPPILVIVIIIGHDT